MDVPELQEIAAADPETILVNGWYHNPGDAEAMTVESLAEFLRWQYEDCHPLLSERELKIEEEV